MKNRVQSRFKKKKRAPAKRSRGTASTRGEQARSSKASVDSEWGMHSTHGTILRSSGLMPEDLKRSAREQELRVSAEGRRELKKHAS